MAKHRRFSERLLLPSLPEGLFLAGTAVFLFLLLTFLFYFQGQTETRALTQREQDALSRHGDTALALAEQVRAAREDSPHLYLTGEELDGLLVSFDKSGRTPCFLSQDDGTLFGPVPCSSAFASSLPSLFSGSGECASLVERDPASGKRYLCVGSVLFLNGEDYRLFTLTDLDPFFAGAAKERRTLFLFSLILSFLAGASLFLAAVLSRRREKTLREALDAMADGSFDLRLPERGSGEKKRLFAAYNRAADAVEESMEALRDSSDSRKRFANSMAHEMKTPLTSILCMGDILRIKREVSPEERRELAGVVVEEAKRMRALSSKLLELASAESGTLERERLSVTALLEDVYAVEAPVLALRGLRLILEPGADALVFGDRELLKSLLCNLIDNAAKASEAGKSIRLAHTVRHRGGKKQVLIAVADEGIGMTREEAALAAEPFYMADKVRSRKAGGAGLGLTLCKEIAERHDATLSIRTGKGKGTTVVLRMPLLEESPTKEKKAGDSPGKKPGQRSVPLRRGEKGTQTERNFENRTGGTAK